MYKIPSGAAPTVDVQAPAWDLAEQQAWTVHTLLDLAMDYIEQEGMEDFVSYLQGIADEENG